MPDNSEVKSKRQTVLERLQGKYPDMDFSDEEQMFGRINDDYDENDKTLSEYKDREGKFVNMYTNDPRSARLMMEWKNGRDPAVVLMELYGDELKEALDDPDKREEIAEANKAYMERVTKEKGYEEEYQRNLAQTLSTLESLQQELGLSDDDIDDAMELLMGIAKDAMLGKFTAESIDMALKAKNYDSDMELANREGEVKGRNARIVEKLRKPQKGDGVPALSGKNGSARMPKKQPDIGALDRFSNDNRSIYERGGERRTPFRR